MTYILNFTFSVFWGQNKEYSVSVHKWQDSNSEIVEHLLNKEIRKENIFISAYSMQLHDVAHRELSNLRSGMLKLFQRNIKNFIPHTCVLQIRCFGENLEEMF